MGHLAGDAHFVEKSFEPGDVARQGFGQKLKRYRLTELEVVGAIDLAHPAFAYQPHDSVAIRKHGPRRESRLIDGVRGG
jgi:hypothetical protein